MTEQFPTAYLNLGDRNNPLPENSIIITTLTVGQSRALLVALELLDGWNAASPEVIKVRDVLRLSVAQFDDLFPSAE
jgi:hypothetical protein